MANGMPYDSDEGRGTAAAITALMTGRAYLQSAKVAAAIGPYERYAENREAHNNVMRMHRDASLRDPGRDVRGRRRCSAAARESWDEAVAARRALRLPQRAGDGARAHGHDLVPDGLRHDRHRARLLARQVQGARRRRHDDDRQPHGAAGAADARLRRARRSSRSRRTSTEHGTIVGAPGLADEHLAGVRRRGRRARDLAHGPHQDDGRGPAVHLGRDLQDGQHAARRRRSRTSPTPTSQAWQLGVKALAIYRDGSKTAQALRTDAQDGRTRPPARRRWTSEEFDEARRGRGRQGSVEARPRSGRARSAMPRERQSLTHKFSIGGHEGYITAGMYEDGTVGEIFLTDIGKEGSTLRGMMNSFATAISIALQYGVPLETLVRKFAYMRFEPEGITSNPEIPFAKSMPDYIMRWLASRFLDADIQEELGILTAGGPRPEDRPRTPRPARPADTAGPANGGNGAANGARRHGPGGPTPQPAAAALTDTPPVVPARMVGLDLGPACNQCGGMMQRTGSCYTCSSCGNNTGDRRRSGVGGREADARRRRPAAPPDAARAPVDHAQVLARRPRGLHHGRHVRRRHGRGDLPDRHRQGGLDPPRHDELVRDRDLDLAAVRRAARDARAQVQLHALRAGRHHQQPGDPVREVDAQLHHALARLALPRCRLQEELGILTPEVRARKEAEEPRCGARNRGPGDGAAKAATAHHEANARRGPPRRPPRR